VRLAFIRSASRAICIARGTPRATARRRGHRHRGADDGSTLTITTARRAARNASTRSVQFRNRRRHRLIRSRANARRAEFLDSNLRN
jgi:hypothetical protein